MELPKREATLKVEVEKGLVAVLRTMTTRELATVWERSAPEVVVPAGQGENAEPVEAKVQLRASMAEMVGVFETHVLGFEGEDAPTFDGKPFVAGDEDHLARLRPAWKVTGGSELINDAMMAGRVRGN